MTFCALLSKKATVVQPMPYQVQTSKTTQEELLEDEDDDDDPSHCHLY